MCPILRRRFDHPGPTVEAALKCEHKYWSRVEQKKAAPDVVPDFAAINPFADDPMEGVELDYPFWIKPVTAHSSNLGFRIDSRQDLDAAIPEIRDRIHLFGAPVNYLCGFADLPDEIKKVDGYHCIAEAIISQGRQCTLEGYRYQGDFQVYGVVDTVRSERASSSLARYEYPSSIPDEVQKRMCEEARRVIEGFGYDDGPFNVEFYWHEDDDSLKLLEINGRISQSHSPLFALVDGSSHQQVIIDLAMGRRPEPPHRQGKFKLAAKAMMRVFEDGVVAHAPTEGDKTLLEQHFPEARFEPHVQDGDRLSDLPFQDSYSFNIADVYLGGENREELLEKYAEAKRLMPFEILRRPEIL
jgi:biotin carboxylase